MKNTLSNKIKAVAITASCLVSAVMPGLDAFAETRLLGYMGDVNHDMEVNVADAVILTQHLLDREDLSGEYSIYADANSDKIVDVFDLILLKQYLTGAREIEGIYGSSDDWTPPTIDEIRDDKNRRISEEDYNKLMEAVELFGIEKYKVVYSYEDMMYSIAIPDWSFASSYDIKEKAYQLIPSWPHIKEDFPEIYQTWLDSFETEESVDEGLKKEYTMTLWRPLADDEDRIIIEYHSGEVLELDYDCIQFQPEWWTRSDWCLIPLDDNGNQIMEVLKYD